MHINDNFKAIRRFPNPWTQQALRFRKILISLLLFFFTFFLIAFVEPMIYGLEKPVPVDPYFNGVFPEQAPSSTSSWSLEDAYPHLSFIDPVEMVELQEENKFLIAGKKGTIWIFDKDPATRTKTVFLDLSDSVKIGDDSGLLGVILHPEFSDESSPNEGYFYVYYRFTPDTSVADLGYLRLSRFYKPPGSDVVDRQTEYVLIQQFDRHNWHNGGGMFFHDGFLFLSIGDEGGADDEFNSTQKIDFSLHAGALRIDVDRDSTTSHPIIRQPKDPVPPPAGWPHSFTQGYYIPDDNPWVDTAGNHLEEFYAIGFRSPHRIAHDPATGNMWVGDIGQNLREKVSLFKKESNLQWPYKEGTLDGPKPKPDSLIGFDQPPVHDYPRSEGISVIGGFVYRGNKWASLMGKYIFGDHGTRKIWTIDYDQETETGKVSYLATAPVVAKDWKNGLSSFATDVDGEVYVLNLYGHNKDGGKIFKLVANSPVEEPPRWLSQTGIFSDLTALTTAPGLIPYAGNAELWSDGATKRGWIAIPNDGSFDSRSEKIVFSPDSDWLFPEGTVVVSHIEMPVDENFPEITKRLETRFLIRSKDDGIYGLTYKWNEAGTDAELMTSPSKEPYTVTHLDCSTSERKWTFLGRSDCLTCHGQKTGGIIGLSTHQLNGDFTYPSTGITDNQLRTWNHLGLFATDIGEANIENFAKSVHISDTSASLEERIRYYLDINCSYCHRPGGVNTNFDARYSTPLTQQNLIYGPLIVNFGMENTFTIHPQDTAKSMIYLRNHSRGFATMPPLGKNLVDEEYLDVLVEWIYSLDPESRCRSVSNLALNQPARQSSTYLDESRYGAGKLVDGNADGETSVNYTLFEDRAWWEVDLGGVSKIQEIKIHNQLTTPDREEEYCLMVADSPFPDETTGEAYPDNFQYHLVKVPSQSASIPVEFEGRFVRIRLENSNYLNLSEVEVLGCVPDNPI